MVSKVAGLMVFLLLTDQVWALKSVSRQGFPRLGTSDFLHLEIPILVESLIKTQIDLQVEAIYDTPCVCQEI